MILLKQFKKIRSDKDTTELLHKDGHKITIAHRSLSPKMKKQLSELPHMSSGGDTSDVVGAAHEADVKRGQVTEGFFGKSRPAPSNSEQQRIHKQVAPKEYNGPHALDLPAGMADGGMTPMSQEQYQSIPGLGPQDTPQQSAPQEPQEPAPSNIQLPQAPSAPQQNQGPGPMPNTPQVSYESQLGQMAQGQQREAAAVGAQGKQEVKAAQEQQKQMQSMQDHFQQKSQEIDSERMALYNDLKSGHVEPQHYLNNLSKFGQAMTAIGVALGGYGAGINGGPNHAMDFLNKQIDRDIDSQKAEMDKKHNMLSVLNQQMGNLRDATTMAKALQMDMYSTKMQELASQSKDPMAQARAQQLIAQMHLQYEPQMQQLKMSQAALQGLKQGDMPLERAIPFFVPKEQQKEALHSAGKLEDLNKNQNTILNYFDQAANDNTVMRTGAGMLRTPASVTALQSMMLPILRDSAGAIREFEFDNVKRMLPQPGDMDSTIAKKRELFINFLNQKRNEEESTLKGFGLPTPKAAPTSFKHRES